MESKKDQQIELIQFSSQVDVPFQKQYKLYKRRFLMASFFAFATISSSMMFSTCNPISSELRDIYSIPTYLVSLAANGFFLMHPLLTFPQTYLVSISNIAVSLKVGCLLTLSGALLRCTTIMNKRFYPIILGSFLAGAGRPFTINIQANVAKEWFRPQDKTTVMMVFSFIITCSNIIGVIIPGQVFKGFSYDGDVAPGKELTGNLMLLEFEIFAFFLIPTILFFQAAPPTPPAPGEKVQDEFTYMQSLKLTFTNRSFILLFLCYSLIMGGFHALAVVIAYLFNPFGFTPIQISYIQSAPIVCGFCSTIIYSIMIKKYKLNLQKVVLFNLVPVLISLGSTYFFMKTESVLIVISVFSVLGFFMIPCIPLCLELACRVLYPINQSIAVGFLLAGVHMWSFLFGQTLAIIVQDQTKEQSFYGCMTVFASFVAAAVCFYNVKIPKHEEDDSTQVSDLKSNQSEGAI